jgi:hypothetical protein
VEAKPDSDGRKKTLAKELEAVNSASDPELVSAAQSLLALIKAMPFGRKARSVCAGCRDRAGRPWQHGDDHNAHTAKE